MNLCGREGDPTPELAQEADEVQHEAFDKYISSRVCIPQGDSMVYGTVKCRKRDQDGELIGRSNKNPLLDTSVYEVELDTGDTEAYYHANIIAESIYSQVDGDGYYTTFALRRRSLTTGLMNLQSRWTTLTLCTTRLARRD
jgi:hypothetical protein